LGRTFSVTTRLLVHHTRINERGCRTALTKLADQLPEPARGYLHASVADWPKFDRLIGDSRL
jgi:hypothetical protein